ncbi:MAG: peptidase U62 [Acidobacteriia bacterium]|nr:peptidase U62 [Terriglobia bacterium]
MRTRAARLAAVLLAAVSLVGGAAAQQAKAGWESDIVLTAMDAELRRSKELKLDGVQPPYFIQYNVTDIDGYGAESAFGILRNEQRVRVRMVRVVVRVGDYKQDSYFGEGEGTVQLLPIENDTIALRHQLWGATDKAYKSAVEALSAKQAALKQFEVDQQQKQLDDFSHEAPTDVLELLSGLELGARKWPEVLNMVSGLYRQDPETQSFEAELKFAHVNRYMVNSEGTIARTGQSTYQLRISGSGQAPDGMRVWRSRVYTADRVTDLPSDDQIRADALDLLATVKALRGAPLVDDEYRGPVLLGPDAAATAFYNLVGENALGRRPRPGVPSRTTGAYANSYKALVLPDFVSIVDDPTRKEIQGRRLLGSYSIDDEGVVPQAVPVVDAGILANYLVGRQPIRDFPKSNGHGRGAAAQPAGPRVGNLIVSSAKTHPPEFLKQELLDLCRKRELRYGYYVESFGPGSTPQLIYRVWANDGHEEIVRGAEFSELDIRAIRHGILDLGDDVRVRNSLEPVPHAVASPSVLMDELVVKRTSSTKDKLPHYPAPPLSVAR